MTWLPTAVELEVEGTETENGWRFHVTVREPGSESRHEVTLSHTAKQRLAGDADPETLVRESFRFLLEREPKEEILPRFDLPLIERFFPDFGRSIRTRLAV